MLEKVKKYLVKRLPLIVSLGFTALLLPLMVLIVNKGLLGWVADLAVHWQWQYLFVTLGCGVALSFLRKNFSWGLIALALLSFMPALHSLAPLSRAAVIKNPVSVASINVFYELEDMSAIVAWVRNNNSDIIVLQEVSPLAAGLKDALKETYPFNVWAPQSDQFGMAVLSKFPLENTVVHKSDNEPAFITTDVVWTDASFGLAVVHPMPPISVEYMLQRDALWSKALDALTPGLPVLMMGDFNATPWSHSIRALAEDGLARASTLIPTHTLFGGLPIDLILASKKDWQLVDSGVGTDVGSDHKPVWAKIQLNSK